MRRRPRRGGHDGLDAIARRRRNVGSAHRHPPRIVKPGRQEAQPVRIREAVVVGVGQDLAGGEFSPAVAGGAQAGVRLADATHPRKPGGDAGDVVAGAVVDHQHLVVGVVQPLQGRQTGAQRRSAVVRADDHRNARPGLRLGRRGAGHQRTDRTLVPAAVDQTEAPALDPFAAAEPFVRVAEPDRAGDGGPAGRVVKPAPGLGLGRLPVRRRVQAKLGDHQRFVASQVLQTVQVAGQGLRLLEVKVHRQKIGVARDQVLRARIGGVAEQACRGKRARPVDQALQKALHPGRSEPAHQGLFNLVADQETDDAGLVAEPAHRLQHRRLDARTAAAVAQEIDMVRPGQANQQPQAVRRRRPQNLPGRRFIETDGIEPQAADAGKVRVQQGRIRKAAAVRSRREGPVGHPLEQPLAAVCTQPLATRGDTGGNGGRLGRRVHGRRHSSMGAARATTECGSGHATAELAR